MSARCAVVAPHNYKRQLDLAHHSSSLPSAVYKVDAEICTISTSLFSAISQEDKWQEETN